MAKATSARRYTDEFKKDAVALLRSSGRPIKEVARQLGISDTSLGAWAREMSETAEPDDKENGGGDPQDMQGEPHCKEKQDK